MQIKKQNEELDSIWNIDKSKDLYGVENWGNPYFSVNENGNISIKPRGENGPELDLKKIIDSCLQRDIELPVLLRFNDILRHRIRTIHNSFSKAIEEYEYAGQYLPAYPIKVNQQKHIVDVITEAGKEIHMGLEVGSKPELIAVMALIDSEKPLLLCNGYKDRAYIEFALTAKKVGKNPVITIEKFSELELVLEVGKELGIEPSIGFRLKLSGKGAGRWEHSGGDRSKFGLSIAEIVKAVELLEKHNSTHFLKLLHFHVGSQITSISSLRTSLREALQVYVQLKRKCSELCYLDVGGGLGVDYDGSKTSFESSMNYSLDEYARDIIWSVSQVCKSAEVDEPHIITESGRATVAHHAVLVFDVLGASSFEQSEDFTKLKSNSKNQIVKDSAELLEGISPKNCHEILHDAIALRNDLVAQFSMGLVSIEDRALGDKIYFAILAKIVTLAKSLHYIPEDLEKIPSVLTETYFCNFSIFQSMPDSWAIEQIFPITPVQRLNENPSARIVLADITCDSDGTVSRFADLRDVKNFLPAHKLRENEPYYLATFLVGAYQEILGDLHNLFGDTNAVHINTSDDGDIEFANIVQGNSVSEVLKYVQYEREDLCDKWRQSLEKAVSKKLLTERESGEIYRKYAKSFDSYTYLKSSNHY